MINIAQKQMCCGCNACGDICPQNAIDYKVDNEGFWYPIVDQNECINCGLCEKTCPILQTGFRVKDNYPNPKCYAAEHKSIETVFASTTGGMFSALAEVMYGMKGYVGGAIHNEDMSVSEYISDKKEDLRLLRRSKDLQSDARGFYKAVKELLDEEKNVLVCGVPCQIAALKCFLGKEYERLVTVDLICLGVNSPKVWRKYLEYIEKKNCSKVVWTENKSKEYGWHNLTQKFVFENGDEYFDTADTSEFIKGFVESHLYCRPSCYKCKFKGFPRVADISIGDFWGIEKYDPLYNSDMGTSVVLINSKKGEDYFDKTKRRIHFKEVPLEWAVMGNQALIKSIDNPLGSRKEFFRSLDLLPFDEAVKKCTLKKKTFIRKKIQEFYLCIRFLKKILKVTRMNPVALYQTVKYSGLKQLMQKKGILCGSHCIINIDKHSKVELEGILTVGCKGHFTNSKQESRLWIGKNGVLQVLGDFEIEAGCDIEVFDNAKLIINGAKLDRSDANKGLTIICGEKIEIGADVGIGRNVLIRDTNGNHYLNTIGYRTTRPIVIGEKAWLCEACTIMPGVKIGRGAIIGVNSTVTRSVPAHAMVSGFPAEIVQENVLWKA